MNGFIAAAPGAPSGLDFLLGMWWIFPMLIVFYLLFTVPQRKQEKKRKAMLDNLERDDRVVTVGGIHGIVKSLTDQEVVLLVDESSKTKIRFSRSAISQVLSDEPAGKKEAAP